jgi:hypothetical protein
MERAEARRLQPHFIASFFLEAFKLLGGTAHEREPNRYEVRHVPAVIRNRDRAIGRGEPVLQRYERVAFDRQCISVPGKPMAAFVSPGHPLLDATIDLVIERHRDLLKRGAVLVDENDLGDRPRALVYLEHAIQDARTDRAGNRRVVSKRLQFIEIREGGQTASAGPAPYLDYRPLTDAERTALAGFAYPDWLRSDLETKAVEHAAVQLVPDHLNEVRQRKEELIDKTVAAVRERLTAEITYWDHRAAQLKDQELAGRTNARLNSGLSRQRADDLSARLQRRLVELEQERKLSVLPPVVLGGAIIVPLGLLLRLQPSGPEVPPTFATDTERSERLAMKAVLETERRLGYNPRDVHEGNRGYDIESLVKGTGSLRFLEVKGRVKGAATVTVTHNEVRTGLNEPDKFILAIVLIDGDRTGVHYIRRPFENALDFTVTSVNFDLTKLLAMAEEPR